MAHHEVADKIHTDTFIYLLTFVSLQLTDKCKVPPQTGVCGYKHNELYSC